MGKTVKSFRMALEGEISRWSGFARALRKPDREAFDIIFEPMIMSILLAHQVRILKLERELKEAPQEKSGETTHG